MALFTLTTTKNRLSSFADTSFRTILGLVIAGLLLPLFPLHSAYVAAMTKLPRVWVLVLSFVLPLAGVFVLRMLPTIPPSLQPVVSVLALIGATYATLKAVAQKSVSHLIAYAGLAFYSIL